MSLHKIPCGSSYLAALPRGSSYLAALPRGSSYLAALPRGSSYLAALPRGSSHLAALPRDVLVLIYHQLDSQDISNLASIHKTFLRALVQYCKVTPFGEWVLHLSTHSWVLDVIKHKLPVDMHAAWFRDACELGIIDQVKYLQCTMDINEIDKGFNRAYLHDRYPVVHHLAQHASVDTINNLLLNAAMYCRVRMFECIERYASIDHELAWKCCSHAVRSGCEEIVKMCMLYKFDLCKHDNWMIRTAIYYNDHDICQLLMSDPRMLNHAAWQHVRHNANTKPSIMSMLHKHSVRVKKHYASGRA